MFLFNGTGNTTQAEKTPTGSKPINCSNFFQAELPADGRFIGLPFGSMFTMMMIKYQCITIGVYRHFKVGRTFQYVYLNPAPDALINESDALFLIGPAPPDWDAL